MKNKTVVIFTIFLTLVYATSLSAQSLDHLKIWTETYPPYNLIVKRELKGISVDLMVQMLKKVKSKLTRTDIKLGPWARGYNSVLEDKNAVLFSTTRTKEREKLFKWVGPIIPTIISVFAKKEKNVVISSLEDLKKYRIGVVRDDIGEQLLTAGGVSVKKYNRISGLKVITRSLKKLNKGRIDLFAYEQSAVKWEIKKNGFNLDDYEVVYILKEGELYYAFHKDSPDFLIQKMQKALDGVKKDGEYQKILDRYLK